MAEQAIDLSLSTIRDDALRLDCMYLFHQWYSDAPAGKTAVHQHPYWHVDCIVDGEGQIETGSSTDGFSAGDCVVIPAGIEHAFHYVSARNSWVSIKCKVTGHPPVRDAFIQTKLTSTGLMIDTVKALLPTDRAITCDERIATGYVLCAMLAGPIAQERQHNTRSLRRQLESLVHTHATHPLSVTQAAEHLGYSASHLSARLRQETGLSPKEIIDRARANLACQRLVYSDENITQVAETMGFTDIYAFSRFFKRLCGESPTSFRQHRQKSGEG